MIIQTLIENFNQYGNQPAITAKNESITYAQLGKLASAVASSMIHLGVKKGDVIALYSDRSTSTLVGIVASMLSGASYTVVEIDSTIEESVNRLELIEPDYVIADDGCRDHLNPYHFEHVKGIYSYQELINHTNSVNYDEDLPSISDNDIAYVLYTSGSTGKPKGVRVSHGNITHYTHSIYGVTQVQPTLRYGHLSTLAADLGNTSLLLSLYTGGHLHLIDHSTRKDPKKLLAYLSDNKIDFIKITPSHWSAISQSLNHSSKGMPKLSHLVFGGEALRKSVVENVLALGISKKVFNHYGPTETTVGVTAFPIANTDSLAALDKDIIPIGKAFGETTLLVKSEDKYYSHSKKGELFIGGPSVAKGYRNLLKQTEERFVTITLMSGTELRCYKTGDHVELDEDGVAHFIGRIDRQVKINGYRVELESIENTIKSLPGVAAASVCFSKINNKSWLMGGIELSDESLSSALIKDMLKAKVPAYMIPQQIYIMESLPRNANGKTNTKAITAILEEKLSNELSDKNTSNTDDTLSSAYQGKSLEILSSILPIYKKYITNAKLDKDTSFYDLGGNSLDSVQLVAELQYKGFDVSANDFIESPSLDGLIKTIIKNNAESTGNESKKVNREKVVKFSAAQDMFFKEDHKNPDLYNQCVLFKINERVDENCLYRAIENIVDQHELLRTAFIQQGKSYFAKLNSVNGDSFYSQSLIAEDLDSSRFSINEVATDLQKSIMLHDGEVFKVHHFVTDKSYSYLLMIAHHLVVDVISWRVITSELTKAYCDLKEGLALNKRPMRYNFWDWVDHFDDHPEVFEIKPKETSNIDASPLLSKIQHTEAQTESFWFGYTPEQSKSLEILAVHKNIPLHLLFLGAFAHEFSRIESLSALTVDVESHGRVTLDNSVDISRVVGWHTSTFPLNITIDEQSIDKTLISTREKYDAVEQLGVNDSWQIRSVETAETLYVSGICYNFLGDTDFPHDDRIDMSPSHLRVGRTRGAENSRFHNIKVSVQKVNAQYIVDVSYPTVLDRNDRLKIQQININYRESINSLLGKNQSYLPYLIEPGTSTGAIHYSPDSLIKNENLKQSRDYSTILLTGASGFIGGYCLKELLDKTDANIVCLIRPGKSKSAQDKLFENWCWYFSKEDWMRYRDRINIIESDLTSPNFGMADSLFKQLANTVDAIYHFAADTRLMGSEKEFYETNLLPLNKIIEFSKFRRIKDIHYMSTLAICGVNREETIFNEDSLDVGQEFQNAYEKTKFLAEKQMIQHELAGYPVFIYRTGNVSGHSATGKFQRNANANRLVQFLNACTKLGMLPVNVDEKINLSPIDVVSAGVVALSLDPKQRSGVYHVDTPYYFSIRELFVALEQNGFRFNHSTRKNFGELFQIFDGTADADLALGKFWSSRKPRKVNYDHSKTIRKMSRLGVDFDLPTRDWIDQFIKHLIDINVVTKPDADLLHIGQFTRSRIFTLPHNPAVVLRKSEANEQLAVG